MTRELPRPGAPDGRKDSPEELQGSLATLLSGERSVYLCLGPEGAVFTVKSPETFAFGESVDTRWFRMTPEVRSRTVLDWIRRAAEYYRTPLIRYAPEREDVA